MYKWVFSEGNWIESTMEWSRNPLKEQTILKRLVVQGRRYGHLYQIESLGQGKQYKLGGTSSRCHAVVILSIVLGPGCSLNPMGEL